VTTAGSTFDTAVFAYDAFLNGGIVACKRFTIRKGTTPTKATLCLPAGATRPAACA
jgi:hypothetical protein